MFVVLAIKCWECRSDSDPKCADPFDNSTLSITDCKQEHEKEHLPGVKATMCRKIRQKVHGEWRYFRSCAWMGEPGIEGDERFCVMRTGSYNIFMEYCTCKTLWIISLWSRCTFILFLLGNSKDGCNDAGSTRPKTIFVALTILATLLVRDLF